jgi:uncharacterized protein YceH (UPF0502 family)
VELDAVQRRIIGCLIEKERATPQGYPLTLNSLRLACNQSTNRDPVTAYEDAELEAALGSLRQRGLTRIVYSTSNRSAKYRHVLGDALHLGDDELAVLAVLLLRGPQTVGELKGRTERLHAFGDLGAVQQTLDRLAAREESLVLRLERQPGQKDARWVHLLGGEPDAPAPMTPGRPPSSVLDRAGDDDHGRGDRADDAGGDGWAAPGGPAPVSPEAPGGEPGGGPAAGTGGTATISVAERVRYDSLLAELTDEVMRLRAEVSALRTDFDAFRSEFG